MTTHTRHRIRDIAQIAGVSSATVDRVLNGRPTASKKSIALVKDALLRLADGADPASSATGVYDVILPRQAGLSTEYLVAAFRYHAARRGVNLRCSYVERLNPQNLADELLRRGREGSLGIAFQALEDPTVTNAVARVSALGIPLLTVVSGLAGMGLGYVGLDNRAAGRTAGYLMGSLCKGSGTVAVLWGGHLYRGHDEREFGFRSILRTDFPNMEVIDVTCTQDDAQEADQRLSLLLGTKPGLAGVYCVGGGIMGAVEALGRDRRTDSRVVVGHNLTANTRDFLLQRRMDIVIHQDMITVARKALDYLLSSPTRQRDLAGGVAAQVITRENLSDQLNIEALREFLDDSSGTKLISRAL